MVGATNTAVALSGSIAMATGGPLSGSIVAHRAPTCRRGWSCHRWPSTRQPRTAMLRRTYKSRMSPRRASFDHDLGAKQEH